MTKQTDPGKLRIAEDDANRRFPRGSMTGISASGGSSPKSPRDVLLDIVSARVDQQVGVAATRPINALTLVAIDLAGAGTTVVVRTAFTRLWWMPALGL